MRVQMLRAWPRYGQALEVKSDSVSHALDSQGLETPPLSSVPSAASLAKLGVASPAGSLRCIVKSRGARPRAQRRCGSLVPHLCKIDRTKFSCAILGCC